MGFHEHAFPILGGLILLLGGGELLVRGAVRLAESIGVSRLLIGLTVVGFGTSTPELVTSVQAALAGSPGIAMGNIVGSNIFNILIILGLAALVWPLEVLPTALRRDGLWVIATALLLTAIGWVWTLDRLAALLFLGLLTAYLLYAWQKERSAAVSAEGHTAAFERAAALEGADPGLARRGAMEDDAEGTALGSKLIPLCLALGGLAVLIVGGHFLVGGSIGLARSLGVSETVIGLTIVAAGTSMPELATSAIAAVRRQSDVALGNVLGSNIYNVLGIGGVTALIAPTEIPAQIARFDNLVMVGVSVLLVALMWTGRTLRRSEGLLLIAGYVLYVWWIWPR